MSELISEDQVFDEEEINNHDELEFDKSAYVLYHQAEIEYPCLSFQIIPDHLGSGQERSNQNVHILYLVAGTQSPKANLNNIFLIKMNNLTAFNRKIESKTSKKNEDCDENMDEGDDEDEQNEEDEEELSSYSSLSSEEDNENTATKNKPVMEWIKVPHNGSINRIRLTTINNHQIVATWSDRGNVHIWNLNQLCIALDDKDLRGQFNASNRSYIPVYSFSGHETEGFAMDWSSISIGTLATGDCRKNIHIWKLLESMSWHVDQRPLSGHNDSVEDLQWSPTESSVLASCSVDKSIKIWDTRTSSSACIMSIDKAHESDVNVISWNKSETFFILSGGDDGVINTWDLRKFADKSKKATPIAIFKHHLAPITSIEWHPTDSTVFGASSEDDQITLWDLAVEKDEDEEDVEGDEFSNLPPQLLFIHQGQKEIKELHWHQQIPGLLVSTAATGFDVFKTISV